MHGSACPLTGESCASGTKIELQEAARDRQNATRSLDPVVGVSSFPVVSRKSRQERGETHNTDACDVCLPAARFRLTASGPPRVVPAAAHARLYARAPPLLIGHPLIGPTRGSAHVRFVRVGGQGWG